jgi:hypothetical protein
MTAGLSLHAPLRAIIELPLAFVLPGASVIVAVRGSRPARPATDVGLAIVVSCAVWMLIALTCFVLRQPLTTAAFMVGIDLIVAAAAAVCVARAVPLTALTGITAARSQGVRLLLFVLAVAACGGTVALGARVVPAPAPYSEIALAGQWADLASSVAVRPGTPAAVEVRVANHTAGRQSYSIVPTMRGTRWPAQSFSLAAGESWDGHVRGIVPPGGCLHRLSIVLRQTGVRSKVGSVTVWLQNGTKLLPGCTP